MPNKTPFPVTALMDAALRHIEREWHFVYFNTVVANSGSPFDNPCGWKCFTFEVVGDDGTEQPYNFRWKDIRIRWNRYCGKEMKCNRHMKPDEVNEMLIECMDAIKIVSEEDRRNPVTIQ